ncbi:hypothetical protein DL771_007856 [Monosporascus sp. 5C6A]|nr:hypothetical protein DL771_007856 [Monosporascus sp. 5C6A]
MPTLPAVSMRRAVHDTTRCRVTRAEFDRNDFDFNFHDTRDTVHTRQGISGSMVPVIFVICALFLLSCFVGLCVYIWKQRRRRHERWRMEMNNKARDNSTSYLMYKNGSASYPTYPNSGPGDNNPVADPPPVYTPGPEFGYVGYGAGGHGIGHSSGHASDHGAGHSGGHASGL